MDRVEAILERGRRARAALEDETVTEAMDYIAEQLQRQWRATTASMTQRREELFHQIAAIDSTRAQLRRWVDDADFEIAKREKAKERRFRVVR